MSSILHLPDDVSDKRKLITTPEFFKSREIIIQFNIAFTFKDIFGAADATANLIEFSKNILAWKEVADHLTKPMIEWYSYLLCRYGEDTKGVFRLAGSVPKEIYLPNDSIIEEVVNYQPSTHQKIVCSNSDLKLIESLENWELLPCNSIPKSGLGRGYYRGTKTKDGQLENGTLLLLPKYEEYNICQGELDI